MKPTLKIHKAELDHVQRHDGQGRRILDAAAAMGVSLQSHYQAPERVRRASGRLDVAALLRGSERPCWRINQTDGGSRGGVDVFFQCALLGSEDQSDVDRRALASLAYAIKLQDEGIPVSLYACWVSESQEISGTFAVGWCDVIDASVDSLAGIIDERTFRDPDRGVMKQREIKFGRAPFGYGGGSARTIKDARQFAKILRDGGIATETAVILDWNGDNQPV